MRRREATPTQASSIPGYEVVRTWPEYRGCRVKLPEMMVPPGHQACDLGRLAVGRVDGERVRDGKRAVLRRGHWSGLAWEPTYWRITDSLGDFATTGRADLEAAALHIKYAKGLVVIGGAGLGVVPYNLSMKKNVKAVVVADPDPDLVAYCRNLSAQWPGGAKVRWWEGQIENLTRTLLSTEFGHNEQPHYLYVDGRGRRGESALEITRFAQHNLMPRLVGWWGQEIDLVRWLGSRGVGLSGANLDLFDQWCLELDMVVCERSSEYLRLCFQASSNRRMSRA